LGLAVLDLMHPDFKEIVAERIRHLRDAKTPVPPLEEKYLRLDGSVVDVEVAATPIVYQGKPGALVMARDVTERKRSMQEIESLAKFPGENLNPVLRIARDGTILYANPSSSPLLELWGCEVGQLLPDDLRQLISESLTVNLRKELEVECGGSTYSLVLAPIADLGYLNIYAANISERKRAEEALKESEKKYRLLVNQIPAVVFQGYGDWSVDFFDNKIEILSGYTKEEFDSRKIKWRDLILPEDLGEAHQIFIEALKTNKSYMREYRIRRKDGASRWIQAIGQIFCDATGKVDYVSGVFFDITEYKQAEKELRKAEERYRSIFENAIEGIFQSTPEGIYISSNTAMAKMFGYESPKELMANITDIKHQVYVDPQRRVEFMRLLEKDGFVKDFEYQVFRKDGSTFWISENARSVKTEKGETHCYEGFMQDITERKRAVEELMRFSKLESLGILAGGIAHDFNNILTAILGNIGLAMLDGKIEDRVQERLAQAEQACLRAQSLAHQLLTFAKGGAPIIKIISIAKLLKESTILALSGSKSRYEFSFPDRLWSVEADEGQIDQVISNLVINADQAMPEGGVIKIRAENFLVGEGSDIPLAMGKYVKLTFADQGIGIPPKYLDKIFDPYFSTKQKGSGLGLATAHSIIQNHSGYIKAESQVGEGTTFHIHLPAVETDPLAEEPERAEWTVGQGRILVMDDEEMVREVLGRLLEHLGYEVDSASDGSQAIEKFVKAKEAGQPFAAVFLDLTVPGGMGGKETMEQLLKIDPQVKAIVSSGYSDDPIMADFQKYGFCKVIAKPYRVVELSKILQKIMSKVN
jgi:two-component system cell cycle sensor histidine kinase/response regulator CckA